MYPCALNLDTELGISSTAAVDDDGLDWYQKLVRASTERSGTRIVRVRSVRGSKASEHHQE